MESFKQIVSILAYGAICFSAVEIYLTINKLWKRKHEKLVVDSISIIGRLVGIIPTMLYSLNFFFTDQWQGMINGLLWATAYLVFIVIGAGFWVPGHRKIYFWTLIKKSIKSERSEIGELAKSFFRPIAAEQVINILGQVAYIDNELHEKEKALIQSFIDTWDISFSWKVFEKKYKRSKKDKFARLRADIETYLATSPPAKQLSQFRDIITMLINIDEKVSAEEEMILEEYIAKRDEENMFYIAIVPQSNEQEKAIVTLLPKLKKKNITGGYAYVDGPFFSKKYANEVMKQYINFNFFTVVLHLDNDL